MESALTERESQPNGESTSRPAEPEKAGLALDIPEMRYQEQYVWLIFLSSLDIMLTWHILRNGGEEVNPVARVVIDAWGLTGAVLFKFALMLFVIIACEVIGRKRDKLARRLIAFGLIVTGFPPVYSTVLITLHSLGN